VLQRCLASVLLRTRYANYEVLIADDHSVSAQLSEWLGRQHKGRVRVIPMQGPLSQAALINGLREQATGDYLALLSAHGEVISPNWIDALLNQAMRPEVGVVGAKLIERGVDSWPQWRRRFCLRRRSKRRRRLHEPAAAGSELFGRVGRLPHGP
jgi:glycosyltransferase involved in cell wall biosynthesis